jgi:tetratricopeptide (TPR) repeat protein
MSPSRFLAVLSVATFLLCPSSTYAQAQDAFVQNLAALVNAAEGLSGDEGRTVVASVDALTSALAEWDRAIAGVESGLASEIGGAPTQVAARMRAALGAAYLQRGRVDAALAQFDTAVALDPTFAEVHVLRGLALELGRRGEDAAAAYRSAWRADSKSAAHAYLYLRSTPTAGDTEDGRAAIARLSSMLEERAASGQPLVRFPSAGLVDEASVPMPVFPAALYADGFALVSAGRHEEAIARLRQSADADPLVIAAAERSPASSEGHRVLGMALFADHQYEKSISEFRTAVRLNPQDERSRLALADALVDSGDPAGGIEALGETARVLPQSARAQWKLGRLYERLGDEQGALRSFEAAATLPTFAGRAHVLAAIGRLHHNRFDLVAAASAYARRIVVSANDSAAHYDLGDVYRSQDKVDEALTEFTVAALLDPASARAFAMIGQMHAALGRDEAALRMLQRAVELDPEHLEARYALSRTLLRLGRAEDARRELLVFEQLQSKAMEQARRRFQDNQLKIEDTLKARDRKDDGR